MMAKSSFLRVTLILFLLSLCYSKKLNEGSKNSESKGKRGAEPTFFQDRHGRNFAAHGRQRRAGGCCTVTPSCDTTTPYRTADGTCNNLANPCWGSAGIPFIRFIPPQYEDGINSPRGFGRPNPLPTPRNISATMVNPSNQPSLQPDPITLMVMQWGQFCDHDMTFTPDLGVPNCCNSTNSSCFNIDTTNDPFYSNFSVNCLPFVRSTPTMCPPNNTREQINERTSFLDASMVYGSSDAEMISLRVLNSFLLRFSIGENQNCAVDDPQRTCGTFLPTRPNSMTNDTEFFAGDIRVEEQPGLTSMHTIFVRMHNHLSQQIANLNPNCPNETIFQETRKLIGALVQHITFNEFLPIVVGQTMMDNYSLHLGDQTLYDSSINPSTPNVFSTAAFRFGHSLIKNTIPRAISPELQLFENFNRHDATITSNNFPSNIVIGIANVNAEPMDHILVEAIQSRLFSTNANFGEDLYSRNIQRGRDHGLPPYPNWANRYVPGSVNSFSDLSSLMPSQVATKLNNLYGGQLNDIDLFPAAIAENSLPDAILGRTLANINAERFRTLKLGDRFWYENTGVFSTNRLNRIYNTRLSAIICLFANPSNNIALLAMQPANSNNNPTFSCTTLRSGGVLENVNDWANLCPTGG